VLEFEFESIPIFPFVGEFDVFHESKYVVMSTDPASKTSINITVVVVTDALLNLKFRYLDQHLLLNY
jgi:hypothetical protein